MESDVKEMKEITKEEAFYVAIDQLKKEREKVEKLRGALKSCHKDLDEGFVSPTAVRMIAELEKVLKETEDKNE